MLTGEGGTLVEVDLTARREVRAIEIGFGPTHLALPEDGIVWALEKADRLLKVDTRTGRVVDETAVDVGENVHHEVQWDHAWVASYLSEDLLGFPG